MGENNYTLPVIIVGVVILVLVGIVAYTTIPPFPKEVEPKIIPVEPTEEKPIVWPEPKPMEEPVVEEPPKEEPVVEEKLPISKSIFERQMEQKGYVKYGAGESPKYVEIIDLEARNIGYDEARISTLTFTVRNLRQEDLSGEVIIDIYGMDIDEITYRTEFFFNKLPYGYKFTKEIPIDHDVKKINRVKKIRIYVYDRYQRPKVNLGEHIYRFKPIDKMKSMELDWL